MSFGLFCPSRVIGPKHRESYRPGPRHRRHSAAVERRRTPSSSSSAAAAAAAAAMTDGASRRWSTLIYLNAPDALLAVFVASHAMSRTVSRGDSPRTDDVIVLLVAGNDRQKSVVVNMRRHRPTSNRYIINNYINMF